MKSKNLLTLFACFVLIITTFINVSIHKKQSSVLGQTISICQKIGGYCTNTCTQTSVLKCLSGKWLGCSTTYCAQKITVTPTTIGSTKPYIVPTSVGNTNPIPTQIGSTKPTSMPTRPAYPTPTNVGSTNPSLGYIPCYEIQKVYTTYCQSTYPTSTPAPSTYPTKTPTPSAKLLTMTPVPSSTRYPTNTPTRAPTTTPTRYPTLTPTKTPTPRPY